MEHAKLKSLAGKYRMLIDFSFSGTMVVMIGIFHEDPKESI